MFYSEYNFFKINFIEPASPLMYGIVELHDHIFFFLNMILFLVLFLIVSTLRLFTYEKSSKLNRYLISQTASPKFEWLRLNSGTTIEVVWTVIPSLVLVLIAIPSFALLYATDELVDPSVTVQVVAHQWYWSYEYNDLVLIKKEASLNYEYAVQVATFLKRLSLLTGFDFNEKDGKDLFIWFIVRDDVIFGLFELKPWIWELYARSVYDFFKFKEHYLEMFGLIQKKPAIYQASYHYENPFYYMFQWGRLAGWWFKTEKFAGNIEFDSYLKQESDLKIGEPRLYETDFPLVLPKFTHIRFMITSEDVIHSWSVPALGIKVDAVPGRINHAHTYIKRSGIFYGQCSELCGVNHAFMPIQIVVFEPHMYYDYIRLSLLNK